MPLSDSFSRITLVSVTGLPDATGAAMALAVSQSHMPGARALLCSPKVPDNLAPGIEHCAIAPLNYHEYSWFILFALWHVVKTDFALVVQDDGWVLNGANWDDEFLQYDYIGAPAHMAHISSQKGSYWLPGHRWDYEVGQPGVTVTPTLNGGFSLRSRRLMRALIDNPHIRVQVPPPHVLLTQPLKMHWHLEVLNEDVQLTGILRPELEKTGIRFAPLEVARRFSIEHAGVTHFGQSAMRIFGHHSTHRALVSLEPPTVRYDLTESLARRYLGENAIIAMFQIYGYRVEFADDQPCESI